MITVERETYDQIINDILPLLEQHWKEVANYQDEIKLEPNLEKYQKAEQAGGLVILAARENGTLIGYSVFFTFKHPHYDSCLVASNDILFVVAAKRNTGAGLKLIRKSESILTKLGVRRITWHCKPKNDFRALLERMGYEVEETILGKLLGDDHGI